MKNPVLLFDDVNERSSLSHGWNAAKEAVQSVVDYYNQMGFGPLTAEDFPNLFRDTDCLLFDKITGGNGLSISGIEIHKNKAMDIIKKPEGYDTLIAELESLKQECLQGFELPLGGRIVVATDNIEHYFRIADDQVVFSDFIAAAIESTGKIFAETDKAKAHLKFANAVTEAFFASGVSEYWGGDQLHTVIRETIDSVNKHTKTFIPKHRSWPR